MPAPAETVEFSAKVSKEEYNRFKNVFPQYGAVSWFINESLRSFNQRIDSNPDLKSIIDDAVNHSLEVARAISVARANK